MLTVERVRQALRSVQDPELLQNIVDLGLVYDIRLGPASQPGVVVEMTLTTPHCPRAEEIMANARRAVEAQPGAGPVDVRLVWDPPWTPYRMAEPLKTTLGLPAEEPAPLPSSASGLVARLRSLFERIVPG